MRSLAHTTGRPLRLLIHGFSSLRIGARLLWSFGTVLALAAVLGATALFGLQRLNQEADALANKWLPSVGDAAAMRISLLTFRDLEIKHSRAADAGYREEYEEKMKEAADAVGTRFQSLKQRAAGDEERALADRFDALWKEYAAINKKVLDFGRGNKTQDATDLSDGAAHMAADDVVLAIDKLSQFNFDGGKANAAEAAVVYARSRIGILSAVAAALVIGVALALAISRGLLRQLGGEPQVAAAVAAAVAAGDLSTPIVVRPGDSTSLMAQLSAMQGSLARVVATVRSGSERVASASGEIAQGNTDLSSRTEHQASALEQTAASMEQLSSTVRQNADNASQADVLAHRASEVAVRGGSVMAKVVETMQGIDQSSRRIADIIGTIDGIAFQTNILALNAAVEAARAGEQGRGFAVVATEVRNLAQRSAAAAREIKTLIAASGQRVEAGSALVGEAGTTMGEVVAAIGRVTALMSEISAASREQSSGVAQVGQAVTQMDKATQQNAALVEQSAAAAEQLRDQAPELVEVVAGFRLSGQAAAASA